jgi:membrane associated rhomboid family serine protease
VFIPLGTDRHKRRPVAVTYALIALNLAAFAGMTLAEGIDPQLAGRVRAALVLVPGSSGWWTYLSYAFLHGGFAHILFNCLFLWVFGPDVEDRLGRVGFLALYIAGAVAAGAAHAILQPAPVVGASGAIAAVTGAFLVFFPYVRVRTLVIFFVIGIFPITAWWFIAFAIARDLFGVALPGASNTAYLAHLGGYAMGAAVASGLLWLKVVPREPYDLFTIGRQAARRRAFKSTYSRARAGPPPAVRRKETEPEVVAPAGPGAEARVRAQRLLAEGDAPGAAAAYLEMRGHADGAALPPLGRRQLYEIANSLFQAGDHANAADAYREFLAAYSTDPEAGRVLLMLGLINARFLNDPTEAKRVVLMARRRTLTDEERALAAELLEEIG